MRRVVLSLCLISFFAISTGAITGSSDGKKVLTDREIADDFIGHIKSKQTKIWDLMAESYKISLSAYANASEDERAEMRKKRVSLFTDASGIIAESGCSTTREHAGHRFTSNKDQQRVNKAFAEFSRAVEALDYRLRDLQVGYAAIDARPPWEGDPEDVCECEEDEDAPCDPGEPCGTDGGISPQNEVLPPRGNTPRLQISPAKDI